MIRIYVLTMLCLFLACSVVSADQSAPLTKPAVSASKTIASAMPMSTNKLPFRISAMTKAGDKVYLGLIDEKSGRTLFLKKGETTWSGYEFVDIDYDKGQALFKKDGTIYKGSIKGSEQKILPDEKKGDEVAPAGPPQLPANIKPLPMMDKVPEETIVLMIDSNKNEALTVYAGEKHKNGFRMKLGDKNYAIPRNVASGLLRSEFMTDKVKAQALKSFPGLVELNEGEDVDKALEERGAAAFPKIPPLPQNIPNFQMMGPRVAPNSGAFKN